MPRTIACREARNLIATARALSKKAAQITDQGSEFAKPRQERALVEHQVDKEHVGRA